MSRFFIPDTNPTWWDVNSTTVKHYLNQGLQLSDFCVLNATAQPLWESYGPNSGVVSEPHSPLVQSRIDLLIYNMTQTVEFDAVFEDQVALSDESTLLRLDCKPTNRHFFPVLQIGARPWIVDNSPLEEPSVTGYTIGWLNHTQVCRKRGGTTAQYAGLGRQSFSGLPLSVSHPLSHPHAQRRLLTRASG
jgi:hypothetical protein